MPCHSCTQEKPCLVPPHPDIAHHYTDSSLFSLEDDSESASRPLGLNDGTIFGRADFPPQVSDSVLAQAATDQPNLRGVINIIVVLVNFKNKSMSAAAPQYFKDLFFSTGKIATGSVTEYYSEVSGKQISMAGDVVGPFTLPQTVEYYAHDGHGIKGPAVNSPNARDMAQDAVSAVEAAGIDLKKYDNKGRADGHVDAFIIVHAGRGGEETRDTNDIWSSKWILPGTSAREVGSSKTKVYPFLTIPEDAKLGVCAHEIGHLVFGWPDLYDISKTPKSRGVGKWCLMGSGSWGRVGEGLAGTTPCHPSAWCKIDQGWIEVIQDGSDSAEVVVNDVKVGPGSTINANRSGSVHKLWSNGRPSKEYFLIENRMRSGYDASLPAEGLLIWHIDDDMTGSNSSDKSHYHVALVDASGNALLTNDGDGSNPFPGTLKKRDFTTLTVPSSKSYSGQDSLVSVRNISDPGRAMKMRISVTQTSGRASKL